MSIVVPNFARSTLRTAITPSSTVLSLAAGQGAYFAIGSGNYMYLTIEDGASVEIVKFTSTGPIVNDQITVERGQDGTSAKSFPAGSCVKVAWNVAQLQAVVNQTFISLFDTNSLPPNTVQVLGVPGPSLGPNLLYAVWVEQRRFWYWTGTSWVELGNVRNGILAGTSSPSGTPQGSVAFYVNTTTGELWYWVSGSLWLQIGGGTGGGTGGPTEEYWVRGAYNAGSLYNLVADSQVELGVISMTNRYRTYPNGVAGNTILQVINQGGSPRTTLMQAAAMEVSVTVRGNFGGEAAPNAVMEMVISNNYDATFYGNAFPVNPAFRPDIVISASTGVLTWPSGTYFDGNLVYAKFSSGPWPNFRITQVNTAFHVIQAGVGP